MRTRTGEFTTATTAELTGSSAGSAGSTAGSTNGAAPASATATESSRSDTSCSCVVRTAAWNTPANASLRTTPRVSSTATGLPDVPIRVSLANRSTSRSASSSLTSSSARAAVAVVANVSASARVLLAHQASEAPSASNVARTTMNHEATGRLSRRRGDISASVRRCVLAPARTARPAGERERPTMRR